MRLVWSQSAAAQDRQRGLLPSALICIVLGGVAVGAGGRDPQQAPRVFRAAAAGLLAAGGLLIFVGGAVFLVQKARKSSSTLMLAAPAEPAGANPESSFRKEDQQ